MTTAAEIIVELGLEPHPEGGWYRETFRDERRDADGLSASTVIYFLLTGGLDGKWHRVLGSAEVWSFNGGAPLVLTIDRTEHRLGLDFAAGERAQAVVPADAWQKASSTGDWTLCTCTVAPGFDFRNFELAPESWEP